MLHNKITSSGLHLGIGVSFIPATLRLRSNKSRGAFQTMQGGSSLEPPLMFAGGYAMQRFYGSLIQEGSPISGIWFTDGVNLTFNRRSTGFVAMFGLLSDTLSIGKQMMTMPISSVKEVEYFKFRLNKKALRLHTDNGVVELVVNKPERVCEIIQRQIG